VELAVTLATAVNRPGRADFQAQLVT
jgi:hypothetical protein